MDRKSGAGHDESEISTGMLYATGLVAGGSLTGVVIAGLQGFPRPPQPSWSQQLLDAVGVHEWARLGGWSDVIGVAMFAVLCVFLVRAARQKLA